MKKFTKFILPILFLSLGSLLFAKEQKPNSIAIATVDSGFGGFFTAKAIEEEAIPLINRSNTTLSITHYGDTKNAPYGSKTPDEIAFHASNIIISAHQRGAHHVFLACNTASTQFEKILTILKSNPKTARYATSTYSILNTSITHLKDSLLKILKEKNSVSVAILSTPATLRSEVYVKELQLSLGIKNPKSLSIQSFKQPRWRKSNSSEVESLYGYAEFSLPTNPKKNVQYYHLAPANWVELIEYQASEQDKMTYVKTDLSLLTGPIKNKIPFDLVAEFCTHFPVFHEKIQSELQNLGLHHPSTEYVQQGKLFASVFKDKVSPLMNKNVKRSSPTPVESLDPRIFITGENIEETKNLVKTVFPTQKTISVEHIDH